MGPKQFKFFWLEEFFPLQQWKGGAKSQPPEALYNLDPAMMILIDLYISFKLVQVETESGLNIILIFTYIFIQKSTCKINILGFFKFSYGIYLQLNTILVPRNP